MNEKTSIPDEKRMDLVLIGHFAIDTILMKESGKETHSLGGGVTYGSLAACVYDSKKRIGIVSRVGNDFDKSMLSLFDKHSIDTSGIVFQGEKTTRYFLEYSNGSRDLSLLSKANNCKLKDIPEDFLDAKAIHLTPIAAEFDSEFLEKLAKHEKTKNSIFGIDVQGMIRGFDEEGHIVMKNDKKTRESILNAIQLFGSRMFFKASDKEAQAVANEKDLLKATKRLGRTGAHILTTMGPRGAYFKGPNKPIVHIPAYSPKKKVDETGAGDCFMATLLLELGQYSEKERTEELMIKTIKEASAAASFLVEKNGPEGFQTKEEVLKRIQKDKRL